MIVYRVTKKRFAHDLSGKGAEHFGGRWNSRGVPLIYTSESVSLAILEVLVHLDIAPKDYVIVSIEIPNNVRLQILRKNILPNAWQTFPHQSETQTLGDNFVQRNRRLVLKVPSAIVPVEHNFLINPNHPDSQKIKIIGTEPFEFDSRLLAK